MVDSFSERYGVAGGGYAVVVNIGVEVNCCGFGIAAIKSPTAPSCHHKSHLITLVAHLLVKIACFSI